MATKKKDKADKAAGADSPAVPPPIDPGVLVKISFETDEPEDEVARLEAVIEAAKARIHELRNPFQEYPKMVNGQTFNTAEEEAAADPPSKEGAE